MTKEFRSGDRFLVSGQGFAITPQTIGVSIVWANDRDVYYRVDGRGLLCFETPLDRFLDIIAGGAAR